MPYEGVRRIRRRTVLKGLGAGVAATGLAGCTGAGGGGGGGSGNLEEVGVVVPQYGLWDTTVPYFVAQEQGFYEEEGLSVSRIDAEGGGGNVRVVVAGDAQVGFATGIAGLFAAYREGTDVRIVSNEMNRSTDLFWYGLADQIDYNGVGDIQGATVGFSNPGSSTNMVAAKAVEGVQGAEAISVGGPPDANAAVEGGEVDLGWSVPPFFLEGVENGDYATVFRGDEVSPFDALSIRVNFVAGSFLENNTETAQAFFAAHQHSLNWAYENLDQTIRIWGEETDNDNTDLLRQAVENGYPREALRLPDIKGLDAANQVAVDFDFLDDPLSEDELNELVDTSPLPGGS